MQIINAFVEAIESLTANKLRSFLTILGIVIGVGAVIAMLAVGNGAEASITGEISGIGTNLLFIFGGGADDVRNPKPLTMSDADALADPFQAPSIEAVAPAISSNQTLSYGGNEIVSSMTGVTPEYFTVRNVEITEGEFITEAHLLGRSAVVIIGTEVADSLFDRKEGVVGETIRIKGQPFKVIGLLKEAGGSSFGSEDNQFIVPMTTASTRLVTMSPSDRVNVIYISAASSDLVPQASDEAAQILRARHRTEIGKDDFTVFSQQDFLDLASSITGIFTVFLGGIAAISLLVGGIGIMNIMLVSVIERTKEIGLRKAMGARKNDILIQFLSESIVLSLFGGIIGILLGWALSVGIGAISTALDAGFTPVIGMDAILLATVFSTAVGLFFGLYPANRAANLVPVEALRYE